MIWFSSDLIKKLLPKARKLSKRRIIVEEFFNEFLKNHPLYASFNLNQLTPPEYPAQFKNLQGIPNQIADVSINEPVKSILCGTIISDASLRIHPRYANARIQTRHSTRQYSWFFWKWMVVLKDYINGLNSIIFQDPDGYQLSSEPRDDEVLGKFKLTTKARRDLTQLHSVICPDNKEQLNRVWLDGMTNYFLMVIWLDDGSLYHSYQGCICLDFFSEEEQQIFCDYLKEVWYVEAYVTWMGDVMTDGRKRHRIFIKNQESLLTLLRIIVPLVPVKEMLYKVMFVPKNNSVLLQRWAAEIKDLVRPEFRDYVEQFYEQQIINQ